MAARKSDEKRKEILRKAFKRAENPDDPFSRDQLQELHGRLAAQASVLKIPQEHRKVLEVVTAIEANSGAPGNFRERESQGLAVHMLFHAEPSRFLN